MISDELRKLLDDDDGLLNTPIKAAAQNADDRLLSSFLEINEFYDINQHAPQAITDDITERRFASRLEGIREDPEKIEKLKPHDKHDLLHPIERPSSIDDILNDDDLHMFDDDTDILTIRNVPQHINRPDYVGRQRRSDDFDRFEPLFQQVHIDLREGKRKLLPYKGKNDVDEGNFFVLRGLVVYVDKIGEYFTAPNGVDSARLRLVFENGTESDILLLSFIKALAEDGRIITEHDDHILDNLKGISHEDIESGYIYVLSSLSTNPNVQSIDNLYKIGFTSRTVEERIKDAQTDPTYLLAPVKVEASYRTYNMNTQKFEHLLHRVFSKARLDLHVRGLDDENYVPDEWFIAPLEIIDQAVTLIDNGEIVNYQYDPVLQQLALREY